MSKVLQEIEKLASLRPQELKKAKKEGRKIIQYTGNFIPEEFIRAAGAEPYLMCRGGEPEPPEVILDDMLRFMNPLARSMAGFYKMGMDPVTPISDLIITHQSECHIGRMTELLEAWGLPIAKVGVPADWDRPFAFEYYLGNLRENMHKVEELTGIKITDEKAKHYMELTNKVNAGLRKISDLRKLPNPPIGTTEFIKLNHYSYMIDPEVMIEKLDELYNELKDAPGKFSEDAPRILIFGHAVAIGDYTVPARFEDSGAVIAAEFMDEGVRPYNWDFDLSDPDPLHAFAKARYLDKPPVNIFQPSWDVRYKYIQQLIKDYKIDGVVSYQLVFDEIYNMEFACVAKWLSETKTPIIKIESSYEYSREAMGSLVTRIESFVEALKEGK
ncbi:MAG: 2-hydroxyacyl-CoA dehydratase subunit D [Candidatus Limivicinus sp.]|jgi:benzoyl-CoA reductase/2-hydroxyglutaryl-CoA dehydratase subunit BcrC/BadD/HgdB